ncbi:MAG: hypothetical protein ABGZ17_26170 [Planctomycetaceae bacterium]
MKADVLRADAVGDGLFGRTQVRNGLGRFLWNGLSMDAGTLRCVVCVTVLSSLGAVHRTPNFTVSATSEAVARRVGQTAEQCRRRLAVEWLGKPMPNWSSPCPIQVKVGQIGAGGATTFSFDHGEVFGWRMTVQGSLERILDSVVPHEVSHTVFASHFRRPLPRWADEGAATLVEHESERRRQTLLLNQVLRNRTRIPLRRLLAMTEYPEDAGRVLSLYAQGYSLADFLVEQGGRERYLEFLEMAHQSGWDSAIRQCYKHASVEVLEKRWRGWVLAGSPRMASAPGTLIAVNTQSPLKQADRVTIRGQNPTGEVRESGVELPSAPDPRPTRTASAPPPRPSVDSGRLSTRRGGRNQAEQAGWSIVGDEGRRSRRSLVSPLLRVEHGAGQRIVGSGPAVP